MEFFKRITFVAVFFLSLALAVGSMTCHAVEVGQSEQAVRDSIKAEGKRLLTHGDTDGFDKLADQYRSTRERSPAGIWQLSLLYNCVDSLDISDPLDPEWDRLEAMTDQWLSTKPTSVAAVIVAARLRAKRAWVYRGDGYAASVNPKSWGPYVTLIESARVILDAHADIKSQDPEWDAVRIAIASQQGARSHQDATT